MEKVSWFLKYAEYKSYCYLFIPFSSLAFNSFWDYAYLFFFFPVSTWKIAKDKKRIASEQSEGDSWLLEISGEWFMSCNTASEDIKNNSNSFAI